MAHEVAATIAGGGGMQHLGDKLRQLRREKGWSQEDLAREVGVSLSTIQRWEKGDVKPYRLARRELERLFKEAGIDGE